MILACPSYFDHQPFMVEHPNLADDDAPHALLAALRRIVPVAKRLPAILAALEEEGWTPLASAGGAEVEWLDVPWDAFRLTGFDAVRLTAMDYPLTGMHVVATTRPNLFARELVDAKYMVPRGLLLMVNDEGLAVFPDDQPWDDDGRPKALGQFRLDPRQFSSHDQAQATAATLTDAGYLVDLSAAPLPLTT